ncbi:MAG: DUF1573 domain-containing protein [Cyclobacteriaceae bacterium]|nr:DUF1573 domain-containing protein [Cyclobacteriaceae bacterium]
MKKQFLGCLLLMMAFSSVLAQQSKLLAFREEIFDFGRVDESGGSVLHEFVFTNNSGRHVKVLTVQASCGCTTPDWTREPIAPGKTGFIQASYNPQGRPGYFNKSLTVTTDLDANPIVLQIKGQVDIAGPAAEKEFQLVNGNWKMKTTSFNMGKVFVRDEFMVKEFQVLNGGSKAISFTGQVVSPKYIRVDVVPAILAPGTKGIVKVSYNGKLKNQYGFQSDNVEITTDDELNPIKSITVYATLEDYFPELTPDEVAKAAHLRLTSYNLDFGRVKQSNVSVREVQFTNTGKKELTIKALQPNCTCLSASASKLTVKPGESSSIKVTLNPQDRRGTQTKALTIYSNDPQNPVQRVTLTAYIED